MRKTNHDLELELTCGVQRLNRDWDLRSEDGSWQASQTMARQDTAQGFCMGKGLLRHLVSVYLDSAVLPVQEVTALDSTPHHPEKHVVIQLLEGGRNRTVKPLGLRPPFP